MIGPGSNKKKIMRMGIRTMLIIDKDKYVDEDEDDNYHDDNDYCDNDNNNDYNTVIKMAIILPTGQWYAPSAVINDAWYCIVLHSIAWYCMVLQGIALYCMVLHGVA